MINTAVTLKFKNGLEARPTALFVQLASKYESQIFIKLMDKKINAKSIMGMMSLGSIKGEQLELIVDGEDEEDATVALCEFLAKEEVVLARN
ncbi:HPr family phosphocarrier protein [Candidatus Epulonipiscium viviparus]|uniref:HPr family phosphocarrier protein n=1 Tax=Candidatus Epulonipiscium viviparus TaxID=420336 RepID=UPI002738149A|nr:HPr family phosphocarrier protein [Candidatus Epulopiscium viviparus]